jgi:hypothetical protein
MSFYWFGDSWVYGDELERETNICDFKKYTFATLVSEEFGQPCVNLSSCGSSIPAMVYKFSTVADRITTDDTVFFCLTADCRTSIFDNKVLKNILPNGYKEKHNTHQYTPEWYKFFDSPDQRLLQYEQSINLIYFWCKYLKVKCWFANLFTIPPKQLFDASGTSSWIVPRDRCLGEFILPLTKNQSLIFNDSPEITDREWSIQKPFVEKYIKPNYCHPNVAGHKKIANEIIKIIKQ